MHPDQSRTQVTCQSKTLFMLFALFGSVLVLTFWSLGMMASTQVASAAPIVKQQGSSTPAPSGTPLSSTGSSASTTGTPQATPTSMWLLADDFVDNRNGWGTSTRLYFENGTLHYKNTEADTTYWASCRACGPFKDIAYEAMIAKVEGPDNAFYGLTFRATSPNTYAFLITSNGHYVVLMRASNQWKFLTPPEKTTDVIHQGLDKNKLRVVTSGSQLQFFINDQLVESVVDATYTSGSVGLMVTSGGIHIRPEYVRVWQVASAAVVTPTPTKSLAQRCDLQPGEAGAIFHNDHPFQIKITIGGGDWGTHDYWLEPNSATVIKFPPGAYTTSVTVDRVSYKFAADRINFEAGKCIEFQNPD